MGSGDAAAEDMRKWCRAHPKIELHAHLNGSIRDSTLLELARELDEKGAIVLADIEPAIMKNSRTLPECFELFDLYHILSTDHAIVTRITKEVIEDFAAENVVYLELRTTPKHSGAKGMTKHSYVKAVLDGLKAVDTVEVVFPGAEGTSQSTLGPNKTVNDISNGAKGKIYVQLLLSIDRRETTASAMETVDLALEMKKNGVVGIDLSGNPVVGKWPTFLPALKYAKEKGLYVTIHCGEVPNQKEVQAILDFYPQRIGHACCLEESEWRKLKISKIPVEICLTSNIRTECISSLFDHHFVHLYNAKHPIALCTDDPGLFSTSLSNEYHIAASTFGLGKSKLHQLAKDAIELAFIDDVVKKELREIFEAAERNLLQ